MLRLLAESSCGRLTRSIQTNVGERILDDNICRCASASGEFAARRLHQLAVQLQLGVGD